MRLLSIMLFALVASLPLLMMGPLVLDDGGPPDVADNQTLFEMEAPAATVGDFAAEVHVVKHDTDREAFSPASTPPVARIESICATLPRHSPDLLLRRQVGLNEIGNTTY